MTTPQVRKNHYFDEYYSFNKYVSSIVGLWPLQNKIQRQLIWGGLIISTTFQIIAEINVLNYLETSKIISDTFPVYIFNLACAVKAVNNTLNNEKMAIMINHIKDYWDNSNEDHLEIRHVYAKQGRLLCMIMSSLIWGAGMIFAIAALIPQFLIWVRVLEGPAKIEFPYPVAFFIDMEKYFKILYIHCAFTIMILNTLIIAVESLYFAFSLHACGMFAEVGWRLENLVRDENLNINLHPDQQEDYFCSTISNIVRKHNEAIEFCKLLESSYRWSFFVIVAINAVMISTTSLQISHSFESMILIDLLRLMIFVTAQVIHLGLECYVSQYIIDHSHAIGDAVMKTKWYLMSLRARKLLNLITMRSRIPCEMTAGSFCTMSISFFGDVLRTSMSYFTLLHSTE